MRTILIAIAALLFMISCSGTKGVSSEKKDVTNVQESAETYGYTEGNAIKVGGDMDGPGYEQRYLNSLTGPNGEPVSYRRLGSCCPFETKNSSFGGGMLDKYAVTYEGKKDTVTLFINMYDKAKLKAPVGFLFEN